MQSSTPFLSHISSVEEELMRVNQKMYERNVELAVRNRTLVILRKMYEIINTSLGLQETAEKLTDAIVSELRFQKGFIALIHKEKKELATIAVSQSLESHSANDEIFQSFAVSLREDDNFCVKSIIYKHRRMTNILHDVLTPAVDEKTAVRLQHDFAILTSIIYPITFGGEVLGTLMLGMQKHVGDLSHAEREILKELIEVVGIAIERAQIYADLESANLRLQELDKLKDEFVSIASHELRTPMTAIKSYLWMVLSGRGGEVPPKQKFYLERAYSSTTRLIHLVNDMLNVSRIESGRITLRVHEVNIIKLVEDTVAEVAPRAAELGITVRIELDGQTADTTPPVLADHEKIQEVLMNLIGNSLKFTPRGGTITVGFCLEGGYVAVRVKDTGVGISKDEQEKLFQKFGLLKSSYTANKSDAAGTGLGLYITKSIIDLHQGKVTVHSEGPGTGTTFGFSLKVYTAKDETMLNSRGTAV